jgi:hypothetical protein
LSAAGTIPALGGTWCWVGADAGSAEAAGGGGLTSGLTLSIRFCRGALIGVGVGVTSKSSSTLSCLDGPCCPAALKSDCDDGRGVDLTGLEVNVGLEADIMGDMGVEGGAKAGISSRVTFCWEKREEADEE